jgi:hypothetical protein
MSCGRKMPGDSIFLRLAELFLRLAELLIDSIAVTGT